MALPIAVHATDATGRKETDAGQACGDHGGGDGGGTERSGGEGRRKVAPADLFNVVRRGQTLDLVVAQADMEVSVDQRHHGRDRTFLPHGRQHGIRRREVLGPWEAMRDDARLQGDQRPAFFERSRHLGTKAQVEGHAASSAPRSSPTRVSKAVVS